MCFDKATALCDILYKRLRNILTYLLTYLLISIDILHFTSVQVHNFSNFSYKTQLSHLAFLANALSTSFVDSARGGILLRHGRTDRRQRSLQLREDALRLGHRYDQRFDDQHSAVGIDVWKLDTTTTAECCRSIVRALFCSICCSRCPLLTPENILAMEISWTIGGKGGGPLLNTPMLRYQIRPEPGVDFILFCHSLQC